MNRPLPVRWPYIQSSATDISPRKIRGRFDALERDLAAIGAKVLHPVFMVHDDVRIEIDAPVGRETEAVAILNKHFPKE